MIAISYFAHDPKTKFFFGSLAWLPAGATFGILQLFPLLYGHPWTNTPFFFFPVCLVIMYLIGWALSAVKSRSRSRQSRIVAQQLAKARENEMSLNSALPSEPKT